MLDDYYIGQLRPEGEAQTTAPTSTSTSTTTTTTAATKGSDAGASAGGSGKEKLIALDPKKRIAFTLVLPTHNTHPLLHLFAHHTNILAPPLSQPLRHTLTYAF